MSYTVSESHGCKIITGQLPLGDLVALLDAWGKRDGAPATPDDEWVVNAILAEVLDAALVAGPHRATRAWLDELLRKPKELPHA